MSAAPQVLVVGGTGFIGSHLAEQLSASGWQVRVASRRGSWPWGPAPGIAAERLDLGSAGIAELQAALEGTDAVVNLAGLLGRVGCSAADYERVNADGAARLAEAARQQARRGGPLRLVHVSTTGVLGPTGPAPRDETTTPRPLSLYERTKHAGEQAALAARGDGLQVVVGRPGLVYGPRDTHLLPLFRAIDAGRFRLIGGGRACWQPVFVTDVVRGLAAALSVEGVDGGCFHLAGAEAVSVAELAGRIAAGLGKRIPRPGLPRPLAWMAGLVLETLCPPLGIDPPLSRGRVRTLTEDRRYRIDAAREQLGVAPEVDLDTGLSRTILWYREHEQL